MGARHTRWFLWTQDPELLRAAADAAWKLECKEWGLFQQQRLAQAIVVAKPRDRSVIRGWLDALTRALTR